MSIFENIGGRITRIVRIVAVGFGTLILLAILLYRIQSISRDIAIHHEFQVQYTELEHRIKVCNDMIDNMIPNDRFDGAGMHCGLMWLQMKRVQTFVIQTHISNSSIQPLVENTFRTAARYAEYQKMMNHPQYKPSDSDE